MTHSQHLTRTQRAAIGAAVVAGTAAGVAGRRPEACPYPVDSAQGQAWERARVLAADVAQVPAGLAVAGVPSRRPGRQVLPRRTFIDRSHPED